MRIARKLSTELTMEVERLVPLPPKQSGDNRSALTRSELSRVNWIALPMIVVTVSQFLLRVSPMFMLGHLDQLSLSSASIATSLCNVTGFSVIVCFYFFTADPREFLNDPILRLQEEKYNKILLSLVLPYKSSSSTHDISYSH